MRFFVAAFGFALMLLVLSDAFEATVFPRRTTRRFRPTRLFFRLLWFLWVIVANWLKPGGRRQHYLSVFGPLGLLTLFAVWVTGLILSFALFHWSLGAPLGTDPSAPSLAACAYLSGETFFTLGYGDLAPTTWTGRFLSVLESGMGFGFLAVVISYLPVLNQAFSDRERTIGLLDARAGSPPTAAELLRRAAQSGDISQINDILWEWERWSAELLEAQLSFPVLGFYRSQHDNQSWLAGLTVILDTCSLLLAHIRNINSHQVQMTFAMARHAAVDLALIFGTPPGEWSKTERLSDDDLADYLQDLEKLELKVDRSASATAKLHELRAMYEPFLLALAKYFLFEIPPIVAHEISADNWQRSAWLARAPGIGSLPADHADEHFG